MYRKIVVALLAGCMCLLCACSTEQIAPPDTSKTEPSVYEDSEGNVCVMTPEKDMPSGSEIR